MPVTTVMVVQAVINLIVMGMMLEIDGTLMIVGTIYGDG